MNLVSNRFVESVPNFVYLSIVFILWVVLALYGVFGSRVSFAANINFADVQNNSSYYQLTWDVFGKRWHAIVKRDSYLGNEIPVIDVSVSTGYEDLNSIVPNCYYRGALADDLFRPLPETFAYINLCHDTLPFIGFVADSSSVYVISKSQSSPTGIEMSIDNPALPVEYQGLNYNNGGINSDISEGLYPRKGQPDLFPSIEIVLEPAYISQFENEYLDRIMANLAFANFIFQQSGLKQINLIAISQLDQNIIWSGGSGSIRSNIQNLRMRTAQASSADMTLVYLGSSVNTTNLWGWGEEGYACDLQRAVAEGISVNTVNVGRASGYNIDLPSLIQRGWILAHEVGHILGGKHIKNDPLMDGGFTYAAALSEYVAGCIAKSYLFESCVYHPRTWKFTDYYTCD